MNPITTQKLFPRNVTGTGGKTNANKSLLKLMNGKKRIKARRLLDFLQINQSLFIKILLMAKNMQT